jgi:Rieske 2Fe-2S family protein
MPGGVLTLPARYYTDPGHFALELERIHYRMWLCAGRAEQIARPGRFFVRQLGNASVIVLRDDEERLAAFHNVCRHRGTLLCPQEEGQLPSRIQCGYHGWTYRLDGTLSAAPHMDEVDGFRLADYPLRPVAVAEWDGHVFINLADDPPPLSEQIAGLPEKFRPWRMEELMAGV